MPTVPTTTHPTAASFAGEGSPPASRGGAAHGSGLGRHRWPVEQTIALVHRFKRLLVCFDRTPEPHQAWLDIACCPICWRRLARAQSFC